MKKLFIISAFLLLLSCEKEGELTRTKVEPIVVPENSIPKYDGVFTPTSGINVTGSVKISSSQNQYILELVNFSISDGPDLKVYLSKANTPSEFVNLGNLTAARMYAIPQTVDVSAYTHVLIHCQQYNHLFAIAPIEITKNN
ncbi:DM13 domain-containing protein [Flavobacterium sp.]|uniref:DM13 domain-containing protein n=1 Tax=Flavobacterium sp. TaxID=239 RepID=UPI003C496BB4